MASESNSCSSGPALTRALVGVALLCSWTRQFVNVTANCYHEANVTKSWAAEWKNLRWTSISSRQSRNTPGYLISYSSFACGLRT